MLKTDEEIGCEFCPILKRAPIFPGIPGFPDMVSENTDMACRVSRVTLTSMFVKVTSDSSSIISKKTKCRVTVFVKKEVKFLDYHD